MQRRCSRALTITIRQWSVVSRASLFSIMDILGRARSALPPLLHHQYHRCWRKTWLLSSCAKRLAFSVETKNKWKPKNGSNDDWFVWEIIKYRQFKTWKRSEWIICQDQKTTRNGWAARSSFQHKKYSTFIAAKTRSRRTRLELAVTNRNFTVLLLSRFSIYVFFLQHSFVRWRLSTL